MNPIFKQVEENLNGHNIKSKIINGLCYSETYGFDFADLLVYYAEKIIIYRVIINDVPLKITNDFTDYLENVVIVKGTNDILMDIDEKVKNGYFDVRALAKEKQVEKRKSIDNEFITFENYSRILDSQLMDIEAIHSLMPYYNINMRFQIDNSIKLFDWEKIGAIGRNTFVTTNLSIDDTIFPLTQYSIKVFYNTAAQKFYMKSSQAQYVGSQFLKEAAILVLSEKFQDWILFHE